MHQFLTSLLAFLHFIDPTITILLILAMGADRMWLGGMWWNKAGRTAWKFLSITLISFSLVSRTHNAWILLLALLPWALYRWLGPHGALLQVPLGPTTDRRDLVYASVPTGLRSTEAGWWWYACLRYTTPCVAVAVVLTYFFHTGWSLVLAGVAIPLIYRVTWALRDRLPYSILVAIGGIPSSKPIWDGNQWYHNEEPCHFAEFLTGCALGAALAII